MNLIGMITINIYIFFSSKYIIIILHYNMNIIAYVIWPWVNINNKFKCFVKENLISNYFNSIKIFYLFNYNLNRLRVPMSNLQY